MFEKDLNYGRHLLDDEDIAAVVKVLKGDLITQGPVVARFEETMAERVGVTHAIAVHSGTAALHIACISAGITPGKTSVTQGITFSATANAAAYCGGDVQLVDIDPDSIGMSAPSLERYCRASGQPDVLLPVHMGGLADDVAPLRRIAPDSIIIEDASHALGGVYPNGDAVGCCRDSDMTVFSFHPVKSITSGEGGMVLTNNDAYAEKLRLLRNHGIQKSSDLCLNRKQAFPDGEMAAPWYQEQQILGYNYRMSDIHAALGLSQLGKLDWFVKRRREIAAFYDKAFSGCDWVKPMQAEASQRARSAMHLYVCCFDFEGLAISRSEMVRALLDKGIGTQVHYLPIYRHPFYRDRMGDVASAFPNSEAYYSGCLSIPLFPGMSDDQAEYVATSIKEVCGR